MGNLFNRFGGETKNKLTNFEKYVSRQSLTRFLARYELFKKTQDIKGSIVECGVHRGGGLMAWAKLSAGLEPFALHRKVIGFDTFEGFVDVAEEDRSEYENAELKAGGFHGGEDIFAELKQAIKEFDENRALSQFEKVELVKGDANITIPKYIDENQHLLVSLLFLDFDLYEPTLTALKYFYPRMPKGSVIAFDEINNRFWPGETRALIEYFGECESLSIKKFSFDPNIAYIIVGD